MKLLCHLGIHRYETRVIWEYPMEYVKCYLKGDMCKLCGHIKKAHQEQTKGMEQVSKYKLLRLCPNCCKLHEESINIHEKICMGRYRIERAKRTKGFYHDKGSGRGSKE